MQPAGKYLKRFDDDNVLDWFRKRWARLVRPDASLSAVQHEVEQDLGCRTEVLSDLFAIAIEEGFAAPDTPESLEDQIRNAPFSLWIDCNSPNLLQVGYTDNEPGLRCFYFFDDHYLAHHRDLATFLLQGNWLLPGGSGSAGFRPDEPVRLTTFKSTGPGAVWVADLEQAADEEALETADQITGLRLPELARFLVRSTADDKWPTALLLLRGLLTVEPIDSDPMEKVFLADIRQHPDDDVPWSAYSDWLQESGNRPAGLHLLGRALLRAGIWLDSEFIMADDGHLWDLGPRSPTEAYDKGRALADRIDRQQVPVTTLFRLDEHVAQVCFGFEKDHHEQLILFDDLWASAHPALANAILRYKHRWDVLTPPTEEITPQPQVAPPR
jgi:uncharacterized protein (TIGR02996 family)